MSENKVTKDMLLADVIQLYPHSAEIMLEYGLHCVGCFANQFDTVEQGALIHGIGEEDIEEMINRINDAIKSQKTNDDDQINSNTQ